MNRRVSYRVRAGVVALLLVGCGPGYQKLEVEKIESVAVTVDDQQGQFCAYAPVALRAVVTYQDGKQALSRVPGEKQKGRLRTSEFAWSSNHGAVDPDAVLSLPHDALAWYDQAIRVRAQVHAKPEVAAETPLRPRFDCGGTLDLRGAPGARGGEAEDGGPGEPGPVVQIGLAYLETARSGRLVLVRVQRGDEVPEHFLIDPRQPQAPFVIDARGGDGGRGGQGVMGIDGLPGVDGEAGVDGVECGDGTPGHDGTDGQPGAPGGPAGNGGDGAPGGTVFVRHDAQYPELAAQIQVLVDGGEAGVAGTGGAGGRGGKGGKGGAGGTGWTPAANAGVVDPGCAGVDGPKGADGVAGASGAAGPGGEPGTPGPPGELHVSPAPVVELFAGEIERGIPILTGAGGT
jgi:hypothetical protein